MQKFLKRTRRQKKKGKCFKFKRNEGKEKYLVASK